MPAYQPPTNVTRVQITWHPDPDVAHPRIEVRGFDDQGLVLLNEREQQTLLAAFYDHTSPKSAHADAVAQGFLQAVGLLQHVVERMVVPDEEEGMKILTHPDGQPFVTDQWMNVATALFPPPKPSPAEEPGGG